MGNETKTTKTTNATANNNERPQIKLTNRTIVGVTRGEKKRYYIEVDGEPFDGFNKDGEEIKTNSFSMDLSQIVKQIGTKSEMLSVAYTMASVAKGTLNPEIVALCLVGNSISTQRDLKLSTDARETGVEGDVYGKDTWKNTITDFKSNLSAFATNVISAKIMNPKELILKENKELPTLNNVFAALGN